MSTNRRHDFYDLENANSFALAFSYSAKFIVAISFRLFDATTSSAE